MKRKSRYKEFAVRHHEERRGWRLVMMLGIVLFAVYGLISFIYHRTHTDSEGTPIAFFAEKVSDWIAERKGQSHKAKHSPKRVASNEQSSEPQIHFEFYKTLPNAEMPQLKTDKPSPKQMIADADQLEREILEAAQGGRKQQASRGKKL